MGYNCAMYNCLITPSTAASPSNGGRWKLIATIIGRACSFTIHTFCVFQKCPRSGSLICPLKERVSFWRKTPQDAQSRTKWGGSQTPVGPYITTNCIIMMKQYVLGLNLHDSVTLELLIYFIVLFFTMNTQRSAGTEEPIPMECKQWAGGHYIKNTTHWTMLM